MNGAQGLSESAQRAQILATLSITLVGVLGAVGALGLFEGRSILVQAAGFVAGLYWLLSVVMCLAVISGSAGDSWVRRGFSTAVLAVLVTGITL
jgi:hypothetical protein